MSSPSNSFQLLFFVVFFLNEILLQLIKNVTFPSKCFFIITGCAGPYLLYNVGSSLWLHFISCGSVLWLQISANVWSFPYVFYISFWVKSTHFPWGWVSVSSPSAVGSYFFLVTCLMTLPKCQIWSGVPWGSPFVSLTNVEQGFEVKTEEGFFFWVISCFLLVLSLS